MKATSVWAMGQECMWAASGYHRWFTLQWESVEPDSDGEDCPCGQRWLVEYDSADDAYFWHAIVDSAMGDGEHIVVARIIAELRRLGYYVECDNVVKWFTSVADVESGLRSRNGTVFCVE